MKSIFTQTQEISKENKNWAIFLSVTCLGISSIVTQIVMLREFLTVFAGNELVIGLILGNWLWLTGLGSYLGRYAGRIRHPIRWLVICQIAIAFLPPAQIVALRAIKSMILPGLMLGIFEAFSASLLLLLPYCLISGFLLTLFAGMASARRDAQQIGHVYILDTVGDILGGLIFSLILVFFFTSFQSVFFIMILNLLAAALLSRVAQHKALVISALSILILSLPALRVLNLEQITARFLFPGQEILYEESTPYGNLAVTQQDDQINVYENGVPIGSTVDPAAAEETVHYAMVQHPKPRRVLLISGGLSGALQEIEKYPVEQIDYVELDPAILTLARKIVRADKDPRVQLIAKDARRVIRSNPNHYDVILMDLPDPSTAQLNRLYTVEFFSEVKKALRKGGILSFGLSGAENYANPQMRLMASAIYQSLRSAFSNILLIPGARQFFVASEENLDKNIVGLLQERGIETLYVNEDYLLAKMTPDRMRAAEKMVSIRTSKNHDFKPISYYAHIQYWLSQFGGSGMVIPILFMVFIAGALIFLLIASNRRVVPTALATTGFTGMGLEIVLLIAFQVIFGYVYQQIGLIITAFLIGAALGAFWSGRTKGDPRTPLFRIDAILACVSFLLAPTLLLFHAEKSELFTLLAPPILFPILTGFVGFLVGAQFPLAAKLTFSNVEETTGSLYAFDLLGACLGAFVMSVFLIPLIGIVPTLYLMGTIKLITAGALKIRQAAPLEEEISWIPDKGALFSFGMMLFIFAGLGVVIVAEQTYTIVYSFSLLPVYHWILLGLLALGILHAMRIHFFPKKTNASSLKLGRVSASIYEKTKITTIRWIYYLGFSLVAFFPIFRCYFKVPYLFCHVCPRPCVFGVVRPYLIPAALIMNLENRYWCYHACPIGTLSDCQAHTGKSAWRWPKWLRVLPILILIFTIVAYFKLMIDQDNPTKPGQDWYSFFFQNVFGVSAVVIVIAVILIFLAYRLRRSFCNFFCPVGMFSDLVLKIEQTKKRNEKTTEQKIN